MGCTHQNLKSYFLAACFDFRRRSYRNVTAAGQFIGSRRYHRGRIVQVLRELPTGESMRVSDLGERRELVHQLAADGLVRIDADERVRLAD